MRRILIDSRVFGIAKQYLELLKKMGSNGAETPSVKLNALRTDISGSTLADRAVLVQYLDKVISDYDAIILAKSEEIDRLKGEFDNILESETVSTVQLTGMEQPSFYKALVKALRYDYVRSSIYPKISNGLGLKTCVYCNAALTYSHKRVYVDKGKKKTNVVSRYELDHFHPKSYYPFLATSFFNLFPVCGSCNRVKSMNPVEFNLYTEDPKGLDVFEFRISKYSLASFVKSFDEGVLEIELDSTPESVLTSHQRVFGIKGLYDLQKDVCAEIIMRAMSYPQSYRNALIRKYSDIKLNREFVDRVVAGNYLNPEDTHRRPLAKLYSDIWNQVYGKREV